MVAYAWCMKVKCTLFIKIFSPESLGTTKLLLLHNHYTYFLRFMQLFISHNSQVM